MNYSFPLAFMANMFAMTVLLIVLGLTGDPVMTTEVGIAQELKCNCAREIFVGITS